MFVRGIWDFGFVFRLKDCKNVVLSLGHWGKVLMVVTRITSPNSSLQYILTLATGQSELGYQEIIDASKALILKHYGSIRTCWSSSPVPSDLVAKRQHFERELERLIKNSDPSTSAAKQDADYDGVKWRFGRSMCLLQQLSRGRYPSRLKP